MPLLYLPENSLATRMYNWLSKAEEITPGVYYPRDALFDLAKKAGFSREVGFTATKNLEEVTNVSYYWDSEERTVYYLVDNISPEEKLERIKVEMEFDML